MLKLKGTLAALAACATLVGTPLALAQHHAKSHQKVVHKHVQRLSNNNHYVNTYGHYRHAPAYTSDGRAPAGATAMCMDGSFSFSESHRGACSHHGGVKKWLR